MTRESLRRSLTESRMRENLTYGLTRGNEVYWTGYTPTEARRGNPDTGQWWSLNSMSFFLYSTSRPDHAPVAKRHGVNAYSILKSGLPMGDYGPAA